MDQVKIGIIGLGNMGSAHVTSLEELKNAKLTALCDTNPAKLKRYEGKGYQLFTDDEEFFKNADVDAVVVATPHYFHVSLVLRALECGKHALTEKPVSVHKLLAEQLLDAAKKYPHLKLAAMFNQRTIPAHKKIKQLIDSGELGEIRRVNWIITNWFRTQAYYDSGDWRASWRGEGGGVLLNQCPHQLDLMQWLFGMPKKVTATLTLGKYHDIEVEDDVNTYCEFADGSTGNFITTTGEFPGTNRLEILGDKGKLVCENDKLTFVRLKTPEREFNATYQGGFGEPEKETLVPETDGKNPQHIGILNNFANAVLGLEPLFVRGQEGIHGVELMDAMLLSTWLDKTVTLPIDDELYLSELNKRIATGRVKSGTDRVLDTEGTYGSKQK